MLKRLVIIILCVLTCIVGGFSAVGCSENKFTIRFEGGAIDADCYYGKQVQTVSSSKEIVEPVYTRPGYNFVGWNKSISKLNKDTTVVAQWKAYDFEVTFYGNGGVDSQGNKSVTILTDSAHNLYENRPIFTKVGYDLSWDKDLKEITMSCSVNAIWTPKKYDLVFKDINGFDFDQNIIKINYNDVVTDINITPPPIQNQKFAYWKGQETGLPLDKGVVWKDDEGEIFEPVYVPESDFLISYDINGGQRSQKVYSYSEQDQGAEILVNPFREGYAFNGWLINDGTEPKLSEDITIEDFKQNGSYKDVKLTAVWENRPYKITFDANGGTISGQTQKEVWYGNALGELPVPQKEGFEFFGWQYDEEIITEQYVWDKESDATLTAIYKAKYYVRFSLSTIIGKDDTEIKFKLIKWGGVVNDGATAFEEVVLELLEGQSLHSRYGFEVMPVVDPIEKKGINEYVFGNCWQRIDENGKVYEVHQGTIFNAENLSGIKGGDTIVLVPFCKLNWSPRY